MSTEMHIAHTHPAILILVLLRLVDILNLFNRNNVMIELSLFDNAYHRWSWYIIITAGTGFGSITLAITLGKKRVKYGDCETSEITIQPQNVQYTYTVQPYDAWWLIGYACAYTEHRVQYVWIYVPSSRFTKTFENVQQHD